jgi:hypothetical protein
MKGIYIYCIKNTGNSKSQMKGIDGLSRVMSIPYKDIEAVVSMVDLKIYGSKALAKKAKEDIKWIVKYAQKHEKIIEHAMGHNKLETVIPMKFGTIFEKDESLKNILKKEYNKFKKILNNFNGKQEWSVKVYAKEALIKSKLKSSEKKLKASVKQAKALPRGSDYFGELEVEKELDDMIHKRIDKLSNIFFRDFSARAVKSQKNKNLTSDLRGRKEAMILNSAYLIDEGMISGFIKEAKALQKINPEFIFEYTGPWPPYNFIK